MQRVVIAGGGFAGLNAAKVLARSRAARDAGVEITLVDQRNHHLFQPLLYQVAMAGLSPAEIAAPIRSLVAMQRNVRVLMGTVRSVDLASSEVFTDTSAFPYDTLILACGARHAYFGNDQWEEHAPGLKTLSQALEIRRRVLTAYELAETCTDKERQRALLTFVVVGGGPTGVELAGALGEMSRFTLARDFRNIDPKLARVILIEAGDRVLPMFDTRLASRAVRDLESLGVQVWTSSPVTAIDADGVEVGRERIEAVTTLWAAGVQASDVAQTLGVPLDGAGRVIVGPDLGIPGHPNVFVAGDLAHVEGDDGKPLPGLAPVAMQQGRYIARTFLSDLRGEPRKPFRYADRGIMATIGRSRAVATTGRLRLTGFVAWMAWLLVHIYFLVGFKNRLFVVLQWAWSYLTFGRGARLIVSRNWRIANRDDPPEEPGTERP